MIRGVGPLGFPGSAEVVNMTHRMPYYEQGLRELPTLGDGRQMALRRALRS